MRERVSGVARHRADAVLLDDGGEQFGAAPERGVPADLLPLAVDLDHRPPDPIRILMQGTERRPLGADVSTAPGVVAVAPDACDLAVGDLNLQAAHGLTQRAGMQVPAVFAGRGHRLGHVRSLLLAVDVTDCIAAGELTDLVS